MTPKQIDLGTKNNAIHCPTHSSITTLDGSLEEYALDTIDEVITPTMNI